MKKLVERYAKRRHFRSNRWKKRWRGKARITEIIADWNQWWINEAGRRSIEVWKKCWASGMCKDLHVPYHLHTNPISHVFSIVHVQISILKSFLIINISDRKCIPYRKWWKDYKIPVKLPCWYFEYYSSKIFAVIINRLIHKFSIEA